VSQVITYLGRLFRGGGVNGAELTAPKNPANALQEAIKTYIFGGSAYGPTGGNYCDETPEIRQRYRGWFRDATVKASVLSKVWDVAAQELQITPDDPENPRDKLIADFHADNIRNAKGGVRALVEATLFGPLAEGYGLCHIRETTAERGKWKDKTVLDALRPKDSDYFDFEFDAYRNISWVIDRYAENERDRRLPRSEFVIIRHLQMFDSLYGMSDFRAIDRPASALHVIQQVRLVWLDKWQGPFLHGKSADKATRDALLGALEQARAQGVLVTDKLTDVEILDLATGSNEAFQSACNDFREEIAVAITGGFLQMMAGQAGTQRGSSQVHANTAKLFRWYLAQLVADAINDQIIPRFTDMNFAGNPPYPKASLEGTDPTEVLADLQVAALKLDMGGELSKKELDRRSGWGPPQDEADKLERAAPIPIPATLTAAAADVAGVGAQDGKAANGKAANGKPPPAAGTPTTAPADTSASR
jgi:hypothetical protein